jgi:hypothetical protein
MLISVDAIAHVTLPVSADSCFIFDENGSRTRSATFLLDVRFRHCCTRERAQWANQSAEKSHGRSDATFARSVVDAA